MTTATGDTVHNFVGAGNQNPAVLPDVVFLNSDWKIDGEEFEPDTTNWGVELARYTGAQGPIVESEIEVIGTPDYQRLGAAAVDASGNGYTLAFGYGTSIRLYRLLAGALDTQIVSELDTHVHTDGDRYRIRVITNASTDNILVLHEGAVVMTATDTTHMTGIGPATFGLREQSSWVGISSWGFTAAAGSTVKSVTDSAVGNDTGLLSAGVGVSDSGVGVDVHPLSVLQQVVETAAAIDNIPGISTLITLTDSAIGSDQNTASTGLSAAESATGSDGSALSVQLAAAELGSGSDAINVLTELFRLVSDLGSGTDGATVTVNVSALDTAIVTDLPTVSVNLATADLGAGLDAVVLITETLKSVIDTGSAIDQINVESLVATSDTGSGSDIPALQVNLSVADSGTGLEVLSKLEQFLLSVSDEGAGLESLGLTVNLTPTDSGSGIDQVYHQALISTLETAGASDVVIRYIEGDTVIASISFTLNSRSVTGSVTSRKTDIKLN